METRTSEPIQQNSEKVESRLRQMQDLLEKVFQLGKFNLKVSIRSVEAGAPVPEGVEWVLDFSGSDTALLLESHAELLDALAYIASKSARLEEDLHKKVLFDCDDYRRTRAEELKLMARIAAERVVDSGEPFALASMNAAERRIVHLALRDQPQVRTESQGIGAQRQVVILPGSAPVTEKQK
ncbi:MAG: protein jag [Terriglobia bacterium]